MKLNRVFGILLALCLLLTSLTTVAVADEDKEDLSGSTKKVGG